MEIYTVLKADHQDIKMILKRLKRTTEKSGHRREMLLQKLKETLVPHSRAEEQVLYDRLKESRVKDADSLAFEGYEEHALVDHLMGQISMTSTDDKKWGALMAVIQENLEHHIREEEKETFVKAKKSFDHETAMCMAEEFRLLKNAFLGELKSGKTPAQAPSSQIVKAA